MIRDRRRRNLAQIDHFFFVRTEGGTGRPLFTDSPRVLLETANPDSDSRIRIIAPDDCIRIAPRAGDGLCDERVAYLMETLGGLDLSEPFMQELRGVLSYGLVART